MNLHASHSLTIVIVGEKAAAGDANVASCTSCWTSTAAATARRANLLANWDSMRDIIMPTDMIRRVSFARDLTR